MYIKKNVADSIGNEAILIYIYGSFYRTPPKKGGVRYPPISEPLNYCDFDLVRWYNFKECWLPVKQVSYINKKN